MSRSIFIHLVWALVAAASFVVGALLFPSGTEGRGGTDTSAIEGTHTALPVEAIAGGSGQGKASNGLPEQGSSFSSVTGALTEQDIESLGERFRTAASPVERRLAFSRLLEGLTADNALQIREQIAHLHHHSAEFREFHYAWGAVAGEEAAMFGASTEEDDMAPALAGWAGSDPDAALTWFKNLDMENDEDFDPLLKERKIPADNLRHHLMRGLVDGLADADPKFASDFVVAMVEDGNKRAAHLMHGVAQEYLRRSETQEAVRWAESLPEGEPRSVALHRLANGYASRDPKAAAEWVEKFSGSDQNYLGGVVGEVGATWAREDPEAALDWIASLPERHGQKAGMRRTFGEWAHRDPTQASDYLNNMPASAAKDSAIQGFTGRLAWENPQAAITWAESISSEQARTEAIIGAGRAWVKKDAAAAADWAVSAGLPEKVQEAIFNPPQRQQRDRD